MDTAAAAAGSGAAQVLKEARILLPALTTSRLIHGNESVQRVVRHLSDTKHVRILGAEIHHQAARPFVHVAVSVVHVPTNDVQEVSINPEPQDDVRDAPPKPVSP